MKFFERFRSKSQISLPIPGVPFKVGDRVRDIYKTGYTVTEIDPDAENGSGIIRAKRDDGCEITYCLFAHGFYPLSEGEKVYSVPHEIVVERKQTDESSASAFLRENRIILHGNCITNCGATICEPYENISATVSVGVLGSLLLRVLTDARTAPFPDNDKAECKKFFRAAGVRSWRNLYQGALNCSIWFTPKQITIYPGRRQKGGYVCTNDDLVLTIPSISTPEQIGGVLREGFSRCE